ncbi:glycosyl hydrolase family 61-domain-containing protein [Xylariaceae sp. FL0594]|nr:glycosyl hydrolase family 61-domain-containing protein [Xylariaceae sp. FL0594]
MGLRMYLAAALAAAPLAQGHFAFVRVALNGEWQAPFRFIRNKTSPFLEDYTPDSDINVRAYIDPTYATDKPDSVRCGRGNMDHAAATDVLVVHAGDTIEVAHVRDNPEDLGIVVWDGCPYERGSCVRYKGQDQLDIMDINHPGPFLAHLSKVPEGQDVHTYDGSGDWVKIYTLGLERQDVPNYPYHFLAWNGPYYQNGEYAYRLPGRFLFNLPKETPAGQYLLRLDMANPGRVNVTNAQIYATCAQIEVVGDAGNGTLPKGIRIPEDMTDDSPGMSMSRSMNNGQSVDADYVYAGGPLWDGVNYVQDKPELD